MSGRTDTLLASSTEMSVIVTDVGSQDRARGTENSCNV